MKRIFSHIIGLLVFSTFLCEGAGIVAWKEHSFHEDSLADVAVYSRKRHNGVEGIFNIKGKEFYIPSGRYWFLELPNSLPMELADTFQYESLLRQKSEMAAFLKRFPKSSPVLDPWLKQLKEYQDKYDSGKYFVNGAWIEKSIYEQQQAELKEQRKQRRLKEEQKRQEATQKNVEAISDFAEIEEHVRLPYVDGSLQEISDGSMDGARTVVQRLEQNKKSLDTAGQNQAQQLIQSIKRLFTAQSSYKKALQQQAGAQAKAEQYERQAENNMRPNPLTGEPNSYMANRARKKARQVILNAENAISNGKEELLQALKQSDALACSLYKSIPQDAENLALAVMAIAESYNGDIDFTSRFEEAKEKEDRRREEIAREQEEKRQQEEIAREREERERQLAREKEKERLQEEREREEQRLREKREQQLAQASPAPQASSEPQAAPASAQTQTVQPKPYLNPQQTNEMIYKMIGAGDQTVLNGIDQKYRDIIQNSTDPVDIANAAKDVYYSKGSLDPVMSKELLRMARYRALSNKVGQGAAYHPSLSRAFPSLPSVIEMGDDAWSEEVDKMVAISKETYNPNLSLACRQRARDIIAARSALEGNPLEPRDLYRKFGISKDTDPNPSSGVTIPIIFLCLLILIPLVIFCRLRKKM